MFICAKVFQNLVSYKRTSPHFLFLLYIVLGDGIIKFFCVMFENDVKEDFFPSSLVLIGSIVMPIVGIIAFFGYMSENKPSKAWISLIFALLFFAGYFAALMGF